jgi:hypothetical protein
MATLNAQQSVNTRDLPELPITGDDHRSTSRGPIPAQRYPVRRAHRLPGTYQFAGGRWPGPISSTVEVASGVDVTGST